ncbi:MAG: biosynthetic-type acetolactate synthase large subunit [Treponema sp.]|nr:biosynthetic-type acetolactate synthase large subunit [Treponema sp.]
MKISGARIVIECLIEQGIDTIFGYPGGAILNIYDELYKNSSRIRHILTAHEQGASHAADGYARSTGKVGVVFATSGPGATNLVTGIATAYMDSVPMVAITCNVTKAQLGKDSFQEIDITGVTMPITKHNYIVYDVEKLADTIREAFLIAQTGRPGPVLIDIPKDVTAALCDYTPLTQQKLEALKQQASKASLKRVLKIHEPSDREIQTIAEYINAAKAPFIYAGGGVVISNAYDELNQLAHIAQIPVSVSLMGKSAFPNSDPLCTGMIGMHGTKASNMAANESDLLIAIGTRFSDRVIGEPKKFARHAKIIQIDIDPAEVNKNIPADKALIGNVKDILKRLLPLIAKKEHSSWNTQVEAWKKEVPSCYEPAKPLYPKFMCEYVRSKLGSDAIISTEVGEHQMWVAQFYNFEKPHTFLTSGGLGTMGYGTGAAIGAKIANPSTPVVHFAGDGSFRMNCNELATIQHYNIPVIIIIVNNGALGNVRLWQNLFYEKRYSQTTLDFGPDFVKLGAAYGIHATRVATKDEFANAFDAAITSGKPEIIDAIIDIDEPVLPMIPPGKPVEKLMMELN